MHRIHLDQPVPEVGEFVGIEGGEAEHAARVKRLGVGDSFGLLDGQGGVGVAVIEEILRGKRDVVIRGRVESRREEGRVSPRVEVWAATPKGSRVDEMVEGLAEVGAAAWVPLSSERSVVDPRAAKLERLRKIAREAGKQCGRAWDLEIGPERGLREALEAGAGTRIVVADASGSGWDGGLTTAGTVRVLVGPEGGWSARELTMARGSGATVVRFGPHTMRIETAAVAACAVVLDRCGAAAGRAVG